MFVTTSAYLSDLLRQTIPAIAGLSHPGLENIWEVGQSGIYTYFVSPPEYGQRLSEIPAQSFNLKTAANIVNDLAAILTYLHQRNFVHGRVTPSEVLLGDRIILKNTGLKQAVEMAEKKWGEDNAEMGVFSFGSKDEVIYRPPEHLLTNDHLLTPRTDQFQLGMLAYSLLVGGDPFPAAEGANDLLISRFTRPIPEPFSHKPDFPGATWTVLQKALSKRPQDRYDSVAEFNQAFQQTIFNG